MPAVRARIGNVDGGTGYRSGAIVIARGAFTGSASETDYHDLERERRIDARDRDRARCEDHAPRCAHCRGRGGFTEHDPEGRPLAGWEPCDACEGSGVSREPPQASPPVCAPITSPIVVTDFGVDDVPF